MQNRIYKKELLDDLSTPFEEIRLNMRELNTINSLLGGHAVTVSGIRKLLAGSQGLPCPVSILEIGCGGGDNLRAVWNWAVKNNFSLSLLGLDYNPHCIAFAQKAFPEASYIEADYRSVQLNAAPDIIFSSLFCHHFTEAELVEQLIWMYQTANRGFVINDLHRHWLAYISIRGLTGMFSRSRLVKHDAPLSVQRGFHRADWVKLLRAAGISTAEISWHWAFRWQVIVQKEKYT